MLTCRILLTALILAAPLHSVIAAPATDPLQTPACQQALAALRANEDQPAAAASQPRGAAWEALRRAAAQACLGERDAPAAAPQRQLQPPVAVPPVSLQRPAATRSNARSNALPMTPSPLPQRPLAVTSCDPGGCWASDGSRLNRVGAGGTLLGPRGVCSLQAGLLNCP